MGFDIWKNAMILLLGIFFSWKYLDKAVGPERLRKQLILDSLLTEEQASGLGFLVRGSNRKDPCLSKDRIYPNPT